MKPTLVQDRPPPPANPAPGARGIDWERHRPVLIALRNRVLRHSGAPLDGAVFLAMASVAAIVHQLARHLAEPMPSWTGAAWWSAYVGAWALFALGTSQSLAFGIGLLVLYGLAGLFGMAETTRDTVLLLALVAVAARVMALLARLLGRAWLNRFL